MLESDALHGRVLIHHGDESYLNRSEDTIRWHALGARCAEARGARGIREVSVAVGIPQYRIRAIERGHLREIRPDLARRYFHFLGIEAWVARWCRANRELARRIGLLDDAPQRQRAPGTRESHRGGKRTPKPTGWVVDFFGAIVAWVTDHLPDGDEYPNVPCRRSPGRRRCRGEIIALLDRTSEYIEWHCPLCGDNGLIHGWQDTPWDRQQDTRSVPTIPSPTTAH